MVGGVAVWMDPAESYRWHSAVRVPETCNGSLVQNPYMYALRRTIPRHPHIQLAPI